MAPVLPGLSDRPEQLEAVVKACVDAGARTITPLLLHLRPGVKEHYLAWLEQAHPRLLPEHEQLYPRAYAPRKRQDELAEVVRELLARHGIGPERPVRAGNAGPERPVRAGNAGPERPVRAGNAGPSRPGEARSVRRRAGAPSGQTAPPAGAQLRLGV
jgi:hypothetical protein